eukprot:11198171-Lingulodinium_polyedra.AAC.1
MPRKCSMKCVDVGIILFQTCRSIGRNPPYEFNLNYDWRLAPRKWIRERTGKPDVLRLLATWNF